MAHKLRTDLNPAEVALSRFVYELYSGVPGKRSPLSDDFAASMRQPSAILDLATHLAKVAKPDFDGEVLGFFCKPNLSADYSQLEARVLAHMFGSLKPIKFDVGTDGDIDELLEMLFGQGGKKRPCENELMEDGTLNVTELWHRAYHELQSAYSDVEFDPAFAEVADDVFRPGIRGHGINVMSVNGAIIKVLRDNDLDHLIEHLSTFMATTHDKEPGDEGGWVYSRAGYDG